MSVNIRKLLEGLVKLEASDLHLKVNQKPMIRLHGVLRPVEHPILTAEDTIEANQVMMPERWSKSFEEKGAADYSYGLNTMLRFRVNAFHQRGAVSLAIRRVNSSIPTFEALNLPDALYRMVDARRGLVLVTGITGSGKSSTLSALINQINQTRREHIITIEDPIEFLYEDDKCMIQQIEVGFDIADFKFALRNALRQDPDIILIGELRDRETVQTAIHCVETGHLVLSTLHTQDARQTIMRILHFFPIDEQPLVSEQLAQSLQAVCCQRLLRTANAQGRVPACEILINTPIVQKLIREERYEDVANVLNQGVDGMQTFDMHLAQLLKSEAITMDEAVKVCHDEAALLRRIKGRRAGGDRGGLI